MPESKSKSMLFFLLHLLIRYLWQTVIAGWFFPFLLFASCQNIRDATLISKHVHLLCGAVTTPPFEHCDSLHREHWDSSPQSEFAFCAVDAWCHASPLKPEYEGRVCLSDRVTRGRQWWTALGLQLEPLVPPSEPPSDSWKQPHDASNSYLTVTQSRSLCPSIWGAESGLQHHVPAFIHAWMLHNWWKLMKSTDD